MLKSLYDATLVRMNTQGRTEAHTDTHDYMTYAEVAEALGRSEGTIHRWANDPAIQLDRKYLGLREVRFLRSQVEALARPQDRRPVPSRRRKGTPPQTDSS